MFSSTVLESCKKKQTSFETMPLLPGVRAVSQHVRCGSRLFRNAWAPCIREIPIEADEDRPIKCVGPDPLRRLAAQYVELMAENNHLRFSRPRDIIQLRNAPISSLRTATIAREHAPIL
jgi:hypothetical protein